MARYTEGINGPFVGKVGTVIGVVRKGTFYMRSLPGKRTGPAKPKEAANRLKFAQAQFWLHPLLGFVREGFKGYSPRLEGFAAAKSCLLKQAFEEAEGNWVINPALVKLSAGDLPLPARINAVLMGNDRIQFSWDATRSKDRQSSDQAMLLVYNIDQRLAVYNLHGQLRKNGSDELPLAGLRGKLHLYIAFVSADRSRRSESAYLGVLTVE